MSGLTTRRFLYANITAVAAHCPIAPVARAARTLLTSGSLSTSADGGASALQRLVTRALVGGGGAGSFALVSEEEVEWLRRQRAEGAEESRIVLSARPTQSLLRGCGGAVLNVALGCLLSPLVGLTIALERLRCGGAVGVVTAPVAGALWGGAFLATALYAAAQQAGLCVWYAVVARPWWYACSRRPPGRAAFFSPLACRFEAPCGLVGARHPLLALYPTEATLRERAMARVGRRQRQRKTASYAAQTGGEGESEGGYYARLGLERGASEAQIRKAYNKLVLQLHPDRNPSPQAAQQFDAVTRAYRVLSNPHKRKRYDLGGVKGVEDLGQRKRDGVRALFGGEAVARLAGDVFAGSFAMRVIDGLDYTHEELAVVREAAMARCRDELLGHYLAHYRPPPPPSPPLESSNSRHNRNSSGAKKSLADAEAGWAPAMRQQLRQLTQTGLGKEVMHAIGAEYLRVIAYYDAEDTTTTTTTTTGAGLVSLPVLALRRVRAAATEEGPHRWLRRWECGRRLLAVRAATFKDTERMVDLAWHTAVVELERTARMTALAVLYEPSLTAEERRRRRDALEALARVFLQYGSAYAGANKRTMDQLMDSLREYQRQQQQQKEREQNE